MSSWETSTTWLNKISLVIFIFSMTTIWHLSMDKNIFVGAVGSSIIQQNTLEESCPPIHQVISKESLVLPLDHAVACKLAAALLDHGLRTSREHCLTQSLTFI